VEEAKSSRHAELALFLLPLSAASWSSLLAARPLLKRRALGCLFVLAAVASLDDWNTKPYRLQQFAGDEGVKCAALYYATPQRGAGCFTIAKQPIERELTRARELGLHFYRRIEGARAPH
jgi:hypothetical protein